MSAGPRLVVLCAGASTRLGRPKALVPLGPQRTPALAGLLAAGSALGDERPLVVSGAEHERLLALLSDAVECVRNTDWARGRTGSIALAARERPGADLCLAPIDVPRVPREVFAALARTWREHGAPERGWLAPFHASGAARRFGHPLVLGRELLAALKEFPPDRPLRHLRALADPLLAVEVDSACILDDLDTPADLAGLERDTN
jgi:CTP:molybdopterin cytidylyltransferase MocA